MWTWQKIEAAIEATAAKNLTVDHMPGRPMPGRLMGNDGLCLTYDARIAAGYVATDWDALNAKAGRPAAFTEGALF